jgi:hypothetical protein
MPVITEFFRSIGSSHWIVVVGVGLLFLLVQMALSVRLYLGARKQDRMLGRLCRDLERGGDGRRDPERLPWSFSWLRWVLTAFPEESASPPGNFSRDEVLHELDTRIASDSSYLLLQRMGIMAPLLGVVLTVVGFYWLKIDATGEQSLQTILVAVTPLVSGVGAGAVLALINQGLLQIVGARMERLRMSARTWFDAAIWRHVGLDAQGATVKAIAAVEKYAGAIAAVADRHASSAARIEATTEFMKHAASHFEGVARSFHGEIQGLPQALCVLRDATAASAQALQELLPIGARAVANLDVSVAAFRTTVDREFTDAAKRHDSASKLLAHSIEQIGESTELLHSTANDMKQAANSNAASLHKVDESLAVAAHGLGDASERLRRTIASDMAPSQQSLHDAAASFARSAAQLSAFIERGLDPATRDLAALHETLSGLESAVDSIKQLSHARADIDQLTETLARAAEIADAISSLPEQIRGILVETMAQRAEHTRSPARMPWLLKRPR